MLKNVVVLCALLPLVFSCHEKEQPLSPDENGETPVPVNKINLVGSYFVTKVESRSGTQRSDITETWFNSYAGNCTRDDLTTFNPDESFVVLDGTVICNESTDDTGTWQLLNDKKLLLDSDTAEIENFTSTTLRIISPVYSSAQSDMIFTYTRK